jgi:phage repressor protein C with HTH and peptisase S24 domain
MSEFTQHQLLLMRIRDERCDGNAAELARKVKKDSTYIHRLFYPPGKKGAKGIGLEIMAACTEAFDLHPGYWDGVDQSHGATQRSTSTAIQTETDLVIPQYAVGGSMGGGLVLEEKQPGIIKSWHVDQEWLRLNVKSHTGAKNLCIVTGFGPSMRPLYNPGDPLLLDAGVKEVDSEGVFFFRVGDHGYIKQLQRIPVGRETVIRAKSLNPTYDPFNITPDMDFEVFGKVLTVWKSEQV